MTKRLELYGFNMVSNFLNITISSNPLVSIFIPLILCVLFVRFEGGLLGLIGVNILAWAVTFFTLGIAAPWALCIKYKWITKHTVIEGRRLKFIGSGGSLFLHYIKWFLLTIITFGIYGFWLYIKMLEWRTENTVFAD